MPSAQLAPGRVFCLAGRLLHLFVPKLSPDKECLILLPLLTSSIEQRLPIFPSCALQTVPRSSAQLPMHLQNRAPNPHEVAVRVTCGSASVFRTGEMLADPRDPNKDPLNRSKLSSVLVLLPGYGSPCLSQRVKKSWQDATIVILFLEGLSAVGICLWAGLQ